MAYITPSLYRLVAIGWTLAVNLFCNMSLFWAWCCQWDEELLIWCMSDQGECIGLPKRAPAALRAVAWKMEIWPIGLDRIKTLTFPLHYPSWYLINWGVYSVGEPRQDCSFLPVTDGDCLVDFGFCVCFWSEGAIVKRFLKCCRYLTSRVSIKKNKFGTKHTANLCCFIQINQQTSQIQSWF